MYNEELEKLIEMALMDGELTEKEKQVLFKRAESFGIDLDEFEMVLDARLYEKQEHDKKVEVPVSAAPKSDKFGDVKKCPACGAMIQSYQTKCVDCGHEFSNIEANASVQKLFKMLNDAEDKRSEGPNDFLSKLSRELTDRFSNVDKVDKKKMEIISNFPIPTTKNDILEFLSIATPKAKKMGNMWTHNNDEFIAHNEFVPVWKTKCEQIIMKARFSLKDDVQTLEDIEYYAKELGIKNR